MQKFFAYIAMIPFLLSIAFILFIWFLCLYLLYFCAFVCERVCSWAEIVVENVPIFNFANNVIGGLVDRLR